MIIGEVTGWSKHRESVNQARGFRIAMLGPRRAGKTTVLACMYDRFRHIVERSGLLLAADTNGTYTDEKLKELFNQLCKIVRVSASAPGEGHRAVNGSNGKLHPSGGYTPDIWGTDLENRYIFYLSRIGKGSTPELTIELVDYPGAWLQGDDEKFESVVSYVRDSEAAVLAIDTPYLMEDGSKYHVERNVPGQVAKAVAAAYRDRNTPHLLLLVPIRCEKYMKKPGFREELKNRVMGGYSELLSLCASPHLRDRVRVVLAPVETTGCLEFSGWKHQSGLPAATFYPNDPDPVFAPRDSEVPLCHVLHFAVDRLVTTRSAGAWGPVLNFFDNHRDFRLAIEKFTEPLRAHEYYSVLQPGSKK